jgi:hypothetical protein
MKTNELKSMPEKEKPNIQEAFQKYWDTQGIRLLTKTPIGHRQPTVEERIFDAFKVGVELSKEKQP